MNLSDYGRLHVHTRRLKKDENIFLNPSKMEYFKNFNFSSISTI